MVPNLKHQQHPVLELVPLVPEKLGMYCRLGEQAYREHYLHLWPNGDPSPYIDCSFTIPVLKKEMQDRNNLHFIISTGEEEIGIVKLVMNCTLRKIPLPEPLFLEKIYLLQAHTGMGYGEKVMSILHSLASRNGAKSICLSAMKKGKALSFYKKLGYAILREELLPFEQAIPAEKDMYLLGKLLND